MKFLFLIAALSVTIAPAVAADAPAGAKKAQVCLSATAVERQGHAKVMLTPNLAVNGTLTGGAGCRERSVGAGYLTR